MKPRLATLHGAYYLVTGLWPLLSMRTFESVTGPKTDRWLVRMVGLLAAVIGASLLARRGNVDRTLPVGSALAFASVDTTYSLRGTISRIYLADALLELALVAGWLRRSTTGRGSRRQCRSALGRHPTGHSPSRGECVRPRTSDSVLDSCPVSCHSPGGRSGARCPVGGSARTASPPSVRGL